MSTPAALPWWADAVVYQLYVRSFADGDGDGRGDLDGIRARLAQIAELGVDAIWLNPCYPSPQHDHGYDVADYFDIEPSYGDLATFDALLADAHALGLRVLMDIVPNHCSNEHAWFRAAVAAGPGSPERDRFYFRDGRGPNGDAPPNNWQCAFAGSAWDRVVGADGVPEQWYLHTFAPEQPDWNWTHPDVRDHFARALRFWLDRGVDGYRVDAPTPVGKHPELPDAPVDPHGPAAIDARRYNPYTTFRPEGHDVWRFFRSVLDAWEHDNPGREAFMVAETYAPNRPDLIAEYLRPDQYHQAFAFDLMLCQWHPASLRRAITDALAGRARPDVSAAWTLNNHDAQRSVTRLGRADASDPDVVYATTVAASLQPIDLALGTRRHRAALAMMLALPGAVYVYQGEELGLPEVLDLPDAAREDPVWLRSPGVELGRDGCRVPIPWTGDPSTSYGFSPTRTAPPWLPQPAVWARYAHDAQAGDPDSMLAFYRRVLALRRAHVRGAFAWRDLDGSVAFDRGDGLLVVTNPTAVPLALPADWVARRSLALSTAPDSHDAAVVPADTTVWLAR
jgi:alpha-glucosidase